MCVCCHATHLSLHLAAINVRKGSGRIARGAECNKKCHVCVHGIKFISLFISRRRASSWHFAWREFIMHFVGKFALFMSVHFYVGEN
jgi:hypothetical protein